MSQLSFTVISKGTGREKLHLVINVGAPGGHVEYCLVLVFGYGGGALALQDVKQARYDDVQNYLLNILKSDATTTTLSCTVVPTDLTRERLSRVFTVLAQKTLGAPQGVQLQGLEHLARYTADHNGSTAWGAILKEVDVGGSVRTEVNSAAHEEQADLDELTGRHHAAPARPAPPPRAPAPSDEEESFDSILGGAEAPPVSRKEETAAALPKLQKLSGVEGKLVYFTARYSKLLAELREMVAASNRDVKKIAAAAGDISGKIRKLVKDVTPVAPDFYATKALAEINPDLNSLYIHRLHFNLPEYKKKSKSEIVRLLSMEITKSSKLEPESISVEFLYKNRFDLPPEIGDRLRDLLRFGFNVPLSLEESYPYIVRKVDLTKLYYRFQPEGFDKTVDTDIFSFRELDGRCSLVYVPYDYLGTGAVNQLLMDFFANPWASPTQAG